jgi:hypothetical protein
MREIKYWCHRQLQALCLTLQKKKRKGNVGQIYVRIEPQERFGQEMITTKLYIAEAYLKL